MGFSFESGMERSVETDFRWIIFRVSDGKLALQTRFLAEDYNSMTDEEIETHFRFLENKLDPSLAHRKPTEICKAYDAIMYISNPKQFKVKLCKLSRFHHGDHEYEWSDVTLDLEAPMTYNPSSNTITINPESKWTPNG